MHRSVKVQASREYVENYMEIRGWTDVFIFSRSLKHCLDNKREFDGKKNVTFLQHWEAPSLEIKYIYLKISTEVEKLFGFYTKFVFWKFNLLDLATNEINKTLGRGLHKHRRFRIFLLVSNAPRSLPQRRGTELKL